MISILITGHANFSSGLYSTLKMVFGVNKNIEFVEFLESDTSENLKYRIREKIKKLLQNSDAVICLTDIKGGTPFKICCELSLELTNKKISIISGANIPMLIYLAAEMEDLTLDEAVKEAIKNGQSDITEFKFVEKQDIDFEDGI